MIIHTADRVTYLIIATLSTELGGVYVGARCGPGLRFALLARRDRGWHVAALPHDITLLASLTLTLRGDPRRRLLAWDPDYLPVRAAADLMATRGGSS